MSFSLAQTTSDVNLDSQSSELNPLQKGTFMLGTNVSGLSFATYNGSDITNINLGIHGGYFLADNFAGLLGINYFNAFDFSNFETNYDNFSYLLGVKYYIDSRFPVELNFEGDLNANNSLGAKVGYAYFPSSNFSIEPSLGYDVSLNDSDFNNFNGSIGLNYFFK